MKSKPTNVLMWALKKCYLLKLLLLLVQLSIFAQPAEHSRHFESYSWEYYGNLKSSDLKEHIIDIPGATSMRLYFKDVHLEEGSYITLTSLEDGAQQTLDAEQLKNWNNSSAYFNGSKVKVEVHQSLKAANTSFKIYRVETGQQDRAKYPVGQCGPTDDRILSYDKAVGRLGPGFTCTGWIINNGKIVTAGHCIMKKDMVIEFNVPLSTSNGIKKYAKPEDQYPVNHKSIIYENNGASGGDDWAVFSIYNNSQTGKSALEAQGKSFTVVQTKSAKNITVKGYGRDDGKHNFVQQEATGPLSEINDHDIDYYTDMAPGASGGPVIDAATGYAIGINVAAGCHTGSDNIGTSTWVKKLWKAMGVGTNPPPPPPSNDIPIGKKISLKGNNGKYVSSENGKKAMNCNRTSVAKWEKFTVVDAGNGKIALKGSNGKYVNSGSPMYCNSSLTSATK
ncbi:MAG: trypsin-like peptidase domain-containing protein, partial [Bacteroidales bacterium]|nr:trypsin-like peptidase domain-containing protein [Bacteroidales bacterium]